MNKAHLQDVAERVLWTFAEAIVAVLAVHTADLDAMWIPIATASLALVKGFIAKHIGQPDASLPLWVQEGIAEATEEIIEVVLAKKASKRSKR